MNFFFDLINDVAGYTEKYYDEFKERQTIEQLIQKYRAEYKRTEQTDSIKTSKLLGDLYPHCLLVIEGADQLFKMTQGSPGLARDYLDTLILRLNVRLFLK